MNTTQAVPTPSTHNRLPSAIMPPPSMCANGRRRSTPAARHLPEFSRLGVAQHGETTAFVTRALELEPQPIQNYEAATSPNQSEDS
jgi:hypothetical protein